MGSWAATISGHNSAVLDGGAAHYCGAFISKNVAITSPRVRQLSSVDPLTFQYMGSFGLAQQAGGLAVIYAHHFRFSFEYEYFQGNVYNATDVFWKLPPGISIDLEVFW